MNTPQTLERLIATSRELYTLPAIALEVLELTSDPDVDAARLRECLQRDPALATKVLRVVNSSLFGLSRQVSDLNQAIALLGSKPLQLLVLGFSLPNALVAGISGEVLSGYWKHALTKAIAAREISNRAWQLPGDEAFIAGLLADVGMLLLVQGLGEPYVQLVKRVSALHRKLAVAERHALGFDHVQLTVQLLEQWKLPAVLVSAIAGSREDHNAGGSAIPPPAQQDPLQLILQLAERMALLLADRQPEVLAEVLLLGQRDHRMNEAQIMSLAESLGRKVEQLAEVLTLDLPGGMDYAEIMAEAHRKLVEAASDVTGLLVLERCDRAESAVPELSLWQEVRELSAMTVDLTPAEATVHSMTAQVVVATESRIASSKDVPALTASTRAAASLAPAVAPRGTTATPDRWPDDLLHTLSAEVVICRQARWPLSLLLFELDESSRVRGRHSFVTVANLSSLIEAHCQEIDHPGMLLVQPLCGYYGLILPKCDWQSVVQIGNELLRFVRTSATGDASLALTISLGAAAVARPSRNFLAQNLIEGANRCLSAAKRAGNTLKSIEIY
jgi:HD-like signal output (HDOD) protein